jgi:hypothetical protein
VTLALSEFRIDDSIGEAFTTDTNTFQDTIASQLMHDQMRIENTTGLDLVRDDTKNEMRMRLFQRSHQFV